MHLHARTVMHSAPRACWRAGRLSHAWPSNASVRRCSQQAYVAKSPCIVVTAVDGIHNQALQELADQVRLGRADASYAHHVSVLWHA
jgi:hypothetical protein